MPRDFQKEKMLLLNFQKIIHHSAFSNYLGKSFSLPISQVQAIV